MKGSKFDFFILWNKESLKDRIRQKIQKFDFSLGNRNGFGEVNEVFKVN